MRKTAAVYTHMEPYKNFATYVRSTISLIKERLKEAQDELAMWQEEPVPTALTTLDGRQPDGNLAASARGYVGRRIAELKEEITSLSHEREVFSALLGALDTCSTCSGRGEISTYPGYATCGMCKGSGRGTLVSA